MNETPDASLAVYLKHKALRVLRRAYGWRSELSSRRFRYIIIVSHQQTVSSLLTQIVCSHPAVAGFGESRTKYRSRADLRKLRGEVFRFHNRMWALEPYVLDKILFDNLLPDPTRIDGDDVRWVFLLRDPIRTLRNMIEMCGHDGSQIQYYLDRIDWLSNAARRLSPHGRSFFTTYDRLLADAGGELAALSRFLALDPPLSQDHELQPIAEKQGAENASDAVSAGRIVIHQREHARRLRSPVTPALLRAYERALYTLSRHCQCTVATREFCDGYCSEAQLIWKPS